MDVVEAINKSQEDLLSVDILTAKFRTFAKENFQDNIRKGLDYIQYIKKSGQFYSFQLPSDKCEFFITSDTVPFFWLCDFPALIKFEEWLRTDAKNKAYNSDIYKSIKELYSKWAIINSENDKRYYALSAIKLIERDANKNNIIKLLLQAVILAYDKRLYQPEKALELLNATSVELSQLKIDDWIKNEFQYQINLLAGFILLKQRLYQEANQRFAEALRNKSNGISSKFYLALTDRKLDNSETASLMLTEVVDYDKANFKLAIGLNNLTLLAYFMQNAITYSIFNEPDFAPMLEEISDIVKIACGDESNFMHDLGLIVGKLKELKLQEFYNDEVLKNISFLEKVHHLFRESQNTLTRFMIIALKEKVGYIINLITDIFTNKYNTEMFERLSLYDIQINDNLEAIKHLTRDIEEHKSANNKKLEESIQAVEKRINDGITIIEKKINNIHLEKRFNPQTAFNNAMVYNLIITIFVFIIGGFSGCYNGTINDVYNFKDVMSAVILSGLKWGTVTFLAGMIIATFTAAFAFMDRASEKQNLIKRITYLKSQKEREIELVKRDHEKKLKSFIDNFNERIDDHKKNIESLKEEKESQFKLLQNDTNNKIQEQKDKLKEALNLP